MPTGNRTMVKIYKLGVVDFQYLMRLHFIHLTNEVWFFANQRGLGMGLQNTGKCFICSTF